MAVAEFTHSGGLHSVRTQREVPESPNWNYLALIPKKPKGQASSPPDSYLTLCLGVLGPWLRVCYGAVAPGYRSRPFIELRRIVFQST